jgi:hypothetical protein
LPEPEIISLLALGVTSQNLEKNIQSRNQAEKAAFEVGGSLLTSKINRTLQDSLGVALQISSVYDTTKNISVPNPRKVEAIILKNMEAYLHSKNMKDKAGIRILTRVGRVLRAAAIKDKVHDTGCTLRVYTKAAVKSLDLQGEMHRYILALLRWKGFKIGEEVVNHRPRKIGKTKYGYGKAVRGFIDLIYIWFINKYSQRPLHMFGYLSIITFLVGTLAVGESVFARIVWSLSLNRNGWFFLGISLMLASILFFSFGIIIDLLIRIHLHTSHTEHRYYVRETIEN